MCYLLLPYANPFLTSSPLPPSSSLLLPRYFPSFPVSSSRRGPSSLRRSHFISLICCCYLTQNIVEVYPTSSPLSPSSSLLLPGFFSTLLPFLSISSPFLSASFPLRPPYLLLLRYPDFFYVFSTLYAIVTVGLCVDS